MDEQSEEAAQKHVLLQQQQLAVCKQVGWEKWRKTEKLKTFHCLRPLASYHYLHFSFTIIRFFLFLMGRGRGCKDVFLHD